MNTLTNQELNNINGGGRMLWYLIGGAALLICGIIDGLVNPQKCNNK